MNGVSPVFHGYSKGETLLIEGYTSLTSVCQGGTITFQLNSLPLSSFQIAIVRCGRTEVTVHTGSGNANFYPTPLNAYEVGCGWPAAYTLQVLPSWVSGLYRADFTAESGAMSIYFVVKPAKDRITSKILFQLATTTYEAYNSSKGKNLYPSPGVPRCAERARRVSFDRPSDADLYTYEIPFLLWMEENGFVSDFCTSVDLHTGEVLLSNYSLLLSVGHDEYWSKEMRDAVERFVTNGGNVGFFSGNVCWWQIRFEDFCRTMVCYKSAAEDPLNGIDNNHVTVNWYDAPVNRPENALTGVSFRNGAGNWENPIPQPGYQVRFAEHWVFDKTGLGAGSIFGTGIVGYETDAAEFFPCEPPQVTGQDGTPLNFQVLATADLSSWSTHGDGGMATMGIFQRNGTVFTAATIDWSLLLQDVIVSQITKNVVERLSRLSPSDAWEQIGYVDNVIAMTGIKWWTRAVPTGSGNKLFSVTDDNKLCWRDPVGTNVKWQVIGHTHSVVTMTALDGKIFIVSDNSLWRRDALADSLLAWEYIGHADTIVTLAASDEKLFATTSDNRLQCRASQGENIPWQDIGDANHLRAMTTMAGRLVAVTDDNKLWCRNASEHVAVWQSIGYAAPDTIALASLDGRLFAATRDNKLWWRILS